MGYFVLKLRQTLARPVRGRRPESRKPKVVKFPLRDYLCSSRQAGGPVLAVNNMSPRDLTSLQIRLEIAAYRHARSFLEELRRMKNADPREVALLLRYLEGSCLVNRRRGSQGR